MSAQKPIVVVGSINLDLVTTAEHIPAAGETVRGSSFQTHPGGKGANQAVAVARLGYPVKMIGKVGSDLFGEQLRAHLEEAGIDLTGVDTAEDSSGTAIIIVAPGGENCIVVTPGANALVSPDYVDSHLELIRNAGLVLAQLEIPMETVEHLAELCHSEGVPLMLDPAPARKLSPRLLGQVRWFTPNETEAAFYVSGETPSFTARALRAHGPSGVILKMGSRGAYLAAEEFEEQVSAIPVKAVDTTAAGDALNGAFAVGLMSGWTPLESLRFAVAAASISVTRPGAQPSMASMAEVKSVLGSPRH
jgi:ribokinase